jgi:hypothetical protein
MIIMLAPLKFNAKKGKKKLVSYGTWLESPLEPEGGVSGD